MLAVSQLHGFNIAGRVTRSFCATASSGANASSYTFSGHSIGSAATDRIVVAAVSWTAFADGVTTSGVTIDGITATAIAVGNSDTGATASRESSLWAARVPAGTTADVVVTLSASGIRCGIATYAIYGARQLTPFATSTDTDDSNPATLSVVTPFGGVFIGTSMANDTSTAVTTGATEDSDFQVGAETQGMTTFSLQALTTQTVATSSTWSGAAPDRFCAAGASWV